MTKTATAFLLCLDLKQHCVDSVVACRSLHEVLNLSKMDKRRTSLKVELLLQESLAMIKRSNVNTDCSPDEPNSEDQRQTQGSVRDRERERLFAVSFECVCLFFLNPHHR